MDHQASGRVAVITGASSGIGKELATALASEPGKASGGYYFERNPRVPNPFVNDETNADRLWEESEKLVRQPDPSEP